MTTTTNPFSAIIGQTLATKLLNNALARNAIAPAYLFYGADGIGKLTTAFAFTHALIGMNTTHHPDILLVEPTYEIARELIPVSVATDPPTSGSPQIRIEQVRQINRFIATTPLKSDRKVVIVDSAQFLNANAANAFIKTLEEPAGTTTIILICNNLDRLPPTIVSRCLPIPFYPLSDPDLRTILANRGIREIDTSILQLSQGSLERAITLIELSNTLPPELQQFPNNLSYSQTYELIQKITAYPLKTQLLLADYWQIQCQDNSSFENLKTHLAHNSNPLLSWEVFLTSFSL